MALLARKRAIRALVEGTAGTYAAPGAAGGYFSVIDPTFTITPYQSDRGIITPTLSKFPKITSGSATVEMSFSCELTGSNQAVAEGDQALPVEALLKGCGFQVFEELEAVTTATVTADVVHGTSTVVSDYMLANFLTDVGNVYCITDETAAGLSTLSGTDAGAVARGYGFDSDSTTTLTIEMYYDGKLLTAIGCCGNVTFDFNYGEAVKLNFTFLGKFSSITNTGLVEDPKRELLPPAFVDSELLIDVMHRASHVTADDVSSKGHRPTFSTLSIDCGNNNSIHQDAGSDDGYDFCRIVDRAPTGSVDIDDVVTTDFDYITKYKAGSTVSMRWFVGDTADNLFEFHVNHALFTGLGDGNRDEITTLDGSFDITHGSINSGGDNEFFFFYIG